MENTESDQPIQMAEACTLCKNISLHDTCFCTFLNPPRLYSAWWSGVRDGQEVRGERDRERESIVSWRAGRDRERERALLVMGGETERESIVSWGLVTERDHR